MINYFEQTRKCLETSTVEEKVSLSMSMQELLLQAHGEWKKIDNHTFTPGWPEKPELVEPQHLPRRKLTTVEGQAAMIHSFAHIEFNAINLAWDIICRFQHMPIPFHHDWSKVAIEEAKHFSMLNSRLNDLGYTYGDFPAHDGLWRMAEETSDNILVRLAVIPRIYEARGLDVTPDLINRFSEIGDKQTVNILNVIYQDEIGHVKAGSEWFRYVCEQRKINAEEAFDKLFKQYAPRGKNKLNESARRQAGFTDLEIQLIS